MLEKLKALELRYEDLQNQLGDPKVYSDSERLRQVNRELKELSPIAETYRGLISRLTAARKNPRNCSTIPI